MRSMTGVSGLTVASSLLGDPVAPLLVEAHMVCVVTCPACGTQITSRTDLRGTVFPCVSAGCGTLLEALSQ